MSHRFEFRSTWRLPGEPDVVYRVLADVAGYPDWWPQVRSAEWLDDESGVLRFHSLLPHELTVRMYREVEDPAARVLRARMEGDLSGHSEWSIRGDQDGTVAVFVESARLTNTMADKAGRLVAPALRFNHSAMMRSGERGLRTHLRKLSD